MFRALVVEKDEAGQTSASVQELDDSRLPEGEVTVAVEYSTLNYKDGLCLGSGGGLVRVWPHVPGIDFAGTVEHSADPRYKPGDKVVLTGWRVGETHWGGYATRARVKADWLVPLVDGLTTRQAMAVGTAGLHRDAGRDRARTPRAGAGAGRSAGDGRFGRRRLGCDRDPVEAGVSGRCRDRSARDGTLPARPRGDPNRAARGPGGNGEAPAGIRDLGGLHRRGGGRDAGARAGAVEDERLGRRGGACRGGGPARLDRSFPAARA